MIEPELVLSSNRQRLLKLLRSTLREHGLRPRKSLGQSFLVEPRGFRLFLKGLEYLGGGDVLEVGSGPGLLSCALTVGARRIISVEIDWAMLRVARGLCSHPSIQYVYGNGVKFADVWRHVLVSNTPYHLSSAIIASCAKGPCRGMVIGVQADVARRIVADPGTREYGRLTVLAKLFFKPSLIGYMPRLWFYPPPDVNGAVLVLSRIREWGPIYEGLERLTACLFSQRNRRASKVVERCTGLRLDYGDRRVKNLRPEEILEVYLAWKSR